MKKVFFVFLVFFGFANADIVFKPEKREYKKGEKICFYVKNNTGNTLFLPSSAPWAVFEDDNFEKLIFSPIGNQVIVKIKPNQEKKWCWKQKNFKNINISTGEYTIRITYFEKGKRKFASFKVKVISDYTDAQ